MEWVFISVIHFSINPVFSQEYSGPEKLFYWDVKKSFIAEITLLWR